MRGFEEPESDDGFVATGYKLGYSDPDGSFRSPQYVVFYDFRDGVRFHNNNEAGHFNLSRSGENLDRLSQDDDGFYISVRVRKQGLREMGPVGSTAFFQQILDLALVAVPTETVPDTRVPVSESEVISYSRQQGHLRDRALELFNGECAVSGCHVEGALDCAHIVSWKEDTELRGDLTNVVVLRQDLHRLFDARHLTFVEADADVVARFSPSCLPHYTDLQSKPITLPELDAPNLKSWRTRLLERR